MSNARRESGDKCAAISWTRSRSWWYKVKPSTCFRATSPMRPQHVNDKIRYTYLPQDIRNVGIRVSFLFAAASGQPELTMVIEGQHFLPQDTPLQGRAIRHLCSRPCSAIIKARLPKDHSLSISDAVMGSSLESSRHTSERPWEPTRAQAWSSRRLR